MPRIARLGPVSGLLLTICLAAAWPAAGLAAAANADYVKAAGIAKRMADGLQSYELKGQVTMANNLRGQTGGATMEAEMVAAARWPDRLLSAQTGNMFNLNLGTGPTNSWFFLGQLGNAYVGQPVKLSRDLEGAAEMELNEAKVFNFYGGLGQFLLDPDLPVVPQTEAGTVTVNGHAIPCQVFRTMGPEVVGVENEAIEGPRVIHFDPASGLVLRSDLTIYFMRNGTDFEQKVTFALSEFALNGRVDDKRFAFQAPTGTRIVDSLDLLTNPDAMTNQPAPDVTFTALDGKTFRLADLRGTPVFIDIWATWCPPCRQEMPHIEKLYREMGASGRIRFVAASSEDPDTVRRFLANNPYTFPIATIANQDAQVKFKAASIPVGFVIDADGKIRAHMVGAQTEEQLRAAFAKVGVK
jgi:thiol-disulfide isomerase/thioredoxin